jgi:hypothetical protein
MRAAEMEAVDSVATVHVEADHVEGDEADA